MARLDELFPRRVRREMWRRFTRTVEFRIPVLRLPWPVVGIIAGGSLLGALGIVIAAGGPILGMSVYTFGLWILLLVGGLLLAQPFAVNFPVKSPDLAGLVRHLAQRNEAWLVGLPPMTREQVWQRLTMVVGEQLGVDSSKLRPEMSFVNDLGCD